MLRRVIVVGDLKFNKIKNKKKIAITSRNIDPTLSPSSPIPTMALVRIASFPKKNKIPIIIRLYIQLRIDTFR